MVFTFSSCNRKFKTPKGLNIHRASCLTSIPRVIISNDDSKIDFTSK